MPSDDFGLLRDWLAGRFGKTVRFATDPVRGSLGHSSDTIILDLLIGSMEPERRKVVVRSAPAGAALLEPYDLAKQYQITQALAATPVPVPAVLGFEADPGVLGRPFFVMDYVEGIAFEREVPQHLLTGDLAVRTRFTDGVLQTIAAIHTVDYAHLGLGSIADGQAWAVRELKSWQDRLQIEDAVSDPALVAIGDWLEEHLPPPPVRPCLLHGDLKLSNFMFRDEEVVAVLDWEIADIGDPLADLAYFLVVNYLPDFDSPIRRVLSRGELIARYQQLTGIDVPDLTWYEVMVEFKIALIYLRMFNLFQRGDTNDLRFLLGGRKLLGCVTRAHAKAGLHGLRPHLPVATPDRVRIAAESLIDDSILPTLADPAAITSTKLLRSTFAAMAPNLDTA